MSGGASLRVSFSTWVSFLPQRIFLRSAFKKSLSSLRVSFSTWAVFLPQRIIFDKRTLKTNFHPSEFPFRPGFLASLSASFLRSVF